MVSGMLSGLSHSKKTLDPKNKPTPNELPYLLVINNGLTHSYLHIQLDTNRQTQRYWSAEPLEQVTLMPGVPARCQLAAV